MTWSVMHSDGEVKKRVRVYRPLSRAGVIGNVSLIVIATGAGLFFGVQQLTLPVALSNVVIALAVAGVLGYFGSGWAMIGLASAFFLGPLATRFVFVGAELSIRAWFMGLIAGWTLGALIRRRADRGRPARDHLNGPALQWWVRGKRFQERSPTQAQVHSKIRALDGIARTLVTFTDGPRQIEVCGNANGRLIVFRTEDLLDDEAWELPQSGPVREDETVEMAMGNVTAPVALGLTVDLQSAIEDADDFMRKRRGRSAEVRRGSEVLKVRPSLP